MRFEIRIEPLDTRPNKTEPGLECRPEAGFGGGQLIQQQGKIKRNDAPDQSRVLEGSSNDLCEKIDVVHFALRPRPTSTKSEWRTPNEIRIPKPEDRCDSFILISSFFRHSDFQPSRPPLFDRQQDIS